MPGSPWPSGRGRRLALACGVDEARAGWLALASPLVAVHAIAGAHNDALVAGLVLAALATAVNRRPAVVVGVVVGVLVGLAVAVKATALVALPFAALLVARQAEPPRAKRSLRPGPGQEQRQGGAWRLMTPVVIWTVVTYAVVAVASGGGPDFVRGLARTADMAQWTSLPTAVGMSIGYGLRALGIEGGYDGAVAAARVVGLAVAAGIVAVAWWRARQSDQDHQVRTTVAVAGMAFAAVAVLGPVFYPWYALVPLAVLAVSTSDERTRAWLATTSAVLVYLILPNGAGLAAQTKAVGAVAVTVALVIVAGNRAVQARSTATGS